MTEIEEKALALVNAVLLEWGLGRAPVIERIEQ